MVARFDRLPIHPQSRATLSFGIVVIAMLVLLLRLWYLQILRGEQYREKAENNRIRTLFLPPPRGEILDRNGRVLAKNRPAFDLQLIDEDVQDEKALLSKISALSGEPVNKLVSNLRIVDKKRRRFEPRILMRDLPFDLVARISAQQYDMPGLIISVRPTREYVGGEKVSHVIGYIGELSQEQLDRWTEQGYRRGDVVGQYGIEARLEDYLRGERGTQNIIVDAAGSKIGETSFGSVLAKSGRNIILTVDYDLQEAAIDALGDRRGAVVAMAPRTGEILAMVSSPTFNPSDFTQALSAADWNTLTGGKEKRMNNRVVQGEYPPGSVFKIFMAAAALAEGVVKPDETFNCPGYYYVGSRRFNCHKHSGHGAVDLHKALVGSCDVYFYNVGQRLGIDRIHDYAVKFGLGRRTGLKLVSERPGLVPSSEWKKRKFKEAEDQKWYPGETPSVVIGQGAVTVTPLQIARGVSALVNGGFVVTPQIVKEITSSDGSTLEKAETETLGVLGVDEKVLLAVRSGLEGVVNEPGGTGHRAQLPAELNIKVAGKTGTAQVVSLELGKLHEHFGDHAWFVGYAPAEKPEIVVTALVENAGHGGVEAAPVAEKVLEKYFEKHRVQEAKTDANSTKP